MGKGEQEAPLLAYDELDEGGAMYNEQDKVKQKKQLHARAFIRETFTYFVFLVIFVWSSSKQVSNMTFPMVDSIRGGLVGSSWTRGKEFVEIRTVGEYWDWFDKVFLPNLRPTTWYGTGRPSDIPLTPEEQRYTQTHNFVLGTFRMRQVCASNARSLNSIG